MDVMLASKLVETLQAAIAEHGDMPVVIHDADTHSLLNIEAVEVKTSAGVSFIGVHGDYHEDGAFFHPDKYQAAKSGQ